MKVPPTRSGKARIWPGRVPGTFEFGFVEQAIVERPVPQRVKEATHGGRVDLELHLLEMGECTILLGHEPGGVNGEMRWHLTISCPDRHPSWDEIKTARYRLLGPDTVMAMILPEAAQYVNVPSQDHVFQLWEIVDEARPWSVT